MHTLTSTDGVNWSSSGTQTTHSGLAYFPQQKNTLRACPSVAYRVVDGTGYFYMAYSACPGNTAILVYRIAAADLYSGSWSQVAYFGETNTMFYKSNVGLFRDENGFIPAGATPAVAFAGAPEFAAISENRNINETQLYYIQF